MSNVTVTIPTNVQGRLPVIRQNENATVSRCNYIPSHPDKNVILNYLEFSFDIRMMTK